MCQTLEWSREREEEEEDEEEERERALYLETMKPFFVWEKE